MLPLLSAILALLAVVAWMAAIARVHNRRLSAVPLRIHIAGTRGKTATVRLVGAGLRAAGRRVLVKTTGTTPVVILPDGTEATWPRHGPPSVSEHLRFFRYAARLGVDTVVIESMAVEPEYLWASERYLVRATLLAVTNLRPDHAEALGETDLSTAMAQATALLMPENGRAILTDEAAAKELLSAAAANDTAVEIIPVGGMTPQAANRALAVAVCGAAGVEVTDSSFEGAGEDAGAFFVAGLDNGVLFYNAFACNDTVSFTRLWKAAGIPCSAAVPPPVVLFSARADRPLRSRAFLAELARLSPPIRLVLTGPVPLRWAVAAGFPATAVSRLGASQPAAALDELAAVAGEGGQIWGTGNFAGLGAGIVGELRRGCVRGLAEGRAC